jgi:hypothetical protein
MLELADSSSAAFHRREGINGGISINAENCFLTTAKQDQFESN